MRVICTSFECLPKKQKIANLITLDATYVQKI